MSVILSIRNLQVEYMYEDVSLTHSCHPCTRLVIATWPFMAIVSTVKVVLRAKEKTSRICWEHEIIQKIFSNNKHRGTETKTVDGRSFVFFFMVSNPGPENRLTSSMIFSPAISNKTTFVDSEKSWNQYCRSMPPVPGGIHPQKKP